ncbi:MAG: M23 family metallopeptidase [Gemmiger sp.]|nr:M23 family metallopeptidase [Gemmiger sp.]
MKELLTQLAALSLWGGAAALLVVAVCAALRRLHAPAALLRGLWLAVAVRFLCPLAIPVALPAAMAAASAANLQPEATGDPIDPAPASAKLDAAGDELDAYLREVIQSSVPTPASTPSAEDTAAALNAAAQALAAYHKDLDETSNPQPGPTFTAPLASYTAISRRYLQDGHNGTDFAAPLGTTVSAPAAGTVLYAGYRQTHGNYIFLNHGLFEDGNHYATLYAHLDSLSVKTGDSVAQGAQLGTVGSTGNSTGSHLHLELYKNDSRVEPLDYIPAE